MDYVVQKISEASEVAQTAPSVSPSPRHSLFHPPTAERTALSALVLLRGGIWCLFLMSRYYIHTKLSCSLGGLLSAGSPPQCRSTLSGDGMRAMLCLDETADFLIIHLS
jgi:hypothetical protein